MTQSDSNKKLADLFIVPWPQFPLSPCVPISSYHYRDATWAITVLSLLKNTMSSSDQHHLQGTGAPFWTSCACQAHPPLFLPFLSPWNLQSPVQEQGRECQAWVCKLCLNGKQSPSRESVIMGTVICLREHVSFRSETAAIP